MINVVEALFALKGGENKVARSKQWDYKKGIIYDVLNKKFIAVIKHKNKWEKISELEINLTPEDSLAEWELVDIEKENILENQKVFEKIINQFKQELDLTKFERINVESSHDNSEYEDLELLELIRKDLSDSKEISTISEDVKKELDDIRRQQYKMSTEICGDFLEEIFTQLHKSFPFLKMPEKLKLLIEYKQKQTSDQKIKGKKIIAVSKRK